MNTSEVIDRLWEHEQELKNEGVSSLTLLGSVARGEAAPNDVDLAAEFDRSRKKVTLLTMSALQYRLTELVGAPVDLSEKAALDSYVRQNAEQDFVVVF